MKDIVNRDKYTLLTSNWGTWREQEDVYGRVSPFAEEGDR